MNELNERSLINRSPRGPCTKPKIYTGWFNNNRTSASLSNRVKRTTSQIALDSCGVRLYPARPYGITLDFRGSSVDRRGLGLGPYLDCWKSVHVNRSRVLCTTPGARARAARLGCLRATPNSDAWRPRCRRFRIRHVAARTGNTRPDCKGAKRMRATSGPGFAGQIRGRERRRGLRGAVSRSTTTPWPAWGGKDVGGWTWSTTAHAL